jgi:L-lactate dehydrogenase complex protein LldE
MEGAEMCCGFGGTFAVKYPPISRAMAEEKVRLIGAAGAEIAVCNEAGCSLNISGMCHRKGVGVRVKHIAELIAEALGMDVSGW